MFVKIKTFFSGESDRSVGDLAAKYNDKQLLISTIEELTTGHLTFRQISEKKVLLKPNWVRHNLVPQDEICLRTHDSILLALLEVVLKQSPANVIIGDAPIQGCDWERMISSSLRGGVKELSDKYGISVEIIDFRRVSFNPGLNNPICERRPASEYVIFDIGKASFLEPVTLKDKNLFRVTNYNPDRLAESHHQGVHKYCITKELFEADVVISLPKVKTHQKTAITAALKNIVGLNGDKDFLPHHRFGGTGFGGDSYPGRNYLRYWAEYFLDNANRHRGKRKYRLWTLMAGFFWKISLPGKEHHLAAGWWGNDTTWRMVLDLNLIAVYGQRDGTLATTPQRTFFSLCDGIIGGQGEGPLDPEPLPLGIISFTDNSMANDRAMAVLMGFCPEKIPLLNSDNLINAEEVCNIILNRTKLSLNDLKRNSVIAKSPEGWENYLKNE